MSSLYMRIQPCDTNPPIELGRLVPWIAYSPPRSVNAASPIGLLGAPPGITLGKRGFSRRMELGAAHAGRMYFPSTRALPLHVIPALPTPTEKRIAFSLS